MSRGLIKDKECSAAWMSLFKNCNCIIHLFEQLCVIPPWITTRPWIDNAAGIFGNFPILITDDQSPILFFNKVRDMDDPSSPLLYEFLFTLASPLCTCEKSLECHLPFLAQSLPHRGNHPYRLPQPRNPPRS